MNKLNQNGAVAEELAALHFLREGYYVFKPILGFGPVDLIAVDAGGDIILADVKAESSRVNTGRSKKSRITRVRSCLLSTSPRPRDAPLSRMTSSA